MTFAFQEQQDPASLSRLNDVVLPPEVSLWPSAPGWALVGAALLVALVVLALQLVRRHRNLASRRECHDGWSACPRCDAAHRSRIGPGAARLRT